DFAGDALDESYEFAKGAMSESLNLVDQNTENSMKFASGALDKFSSSNSENLQMIAGLAGNQAAQNTKNLDKLTELAKFKQDNGQSALNKQQLILMAIIVLVLGFVLFKAVNQ
ncbi:chemotaxis protein, partial [Vibrio mediterranei]